MEDLLITIANAFVTLDPIVIVITVVVLVLSFFLYSLAKVIGEVKGWFK